MKILSYLLFIHDLKNIEVWIELDVDHFEHWKLYRELKAKAIRIKVIEQHFSKCEVRGKMLALERLCIYKKKIELRELEHYIFWQILSLLFCTSNKINIQSFTWNWKTLNFSSERCNIKKILWWVHRSVNSRNLRNLCQTDQPTNR